MTIDDVIYLIGVKQIEVELLKKELEQYKQYIKNSQPSKKELTLSIDRMNA